MNVFYLLNCHVNGKTDNCTGCDVTTKIHVLYCVIQHNFIYARCRLLFGAFAKLRKTTISFIVSACPDGTARHPLNGFSWNFILDWNSVDKIQVSLKSEKNEGWPTLHEDLRTFLISDWILLIMRNLSDKSLEKIKETFHFFFLRKSCLYDLGEKIL
jgi:hypothetical protein